MAETSPQKSNRKQRPPIVVVMGHVDHGKTTLLDYIRKANVAGREAGGITQAVGAYEISHTPAGSTAARTITFIDTPGHEAFTAMRSRGAQAADLAILVVAADEGVKPQTKEAIKILEESKTPFIVAFTKIDKGSVNLEKTKTDVMSAGVMLEGYGGQVSYHGVSAKTGEGVGELLDLILLTADLEDLSYDPSAPASGFVLEARRDPRRGIEASVIIKEGTLSRGDLIKTPTATGKVRILENFLGKIAPTLVPSAPAIIIGFETLPQVGEEFAVGELKQAAPAAKAKPVAQGQAGGTSKQPHGALNLILKASDSGSLEALAVVLSSIDHAKEKGLHIIEQSVGDVTDGDVKHALATGSTIIGFKNRVEKGARNLAEAQSISIITSDIVYDLSKAVEEFLVTASGPAVLGELEVLAVFNQEKNDKQLVGGKITSGTFRSKMPFEILRRMGADAPAATLGSGRILELREKKSEITQAEKGKEIGVLANSQILIQVGDKLIIRK